MPYRLETFDGVPLPEHLPIDDLGTGKVGSSLVNALGGAFDYLGRTRRLPRRHPITFRGKYVGKQVLLADHDGNLIITADPDGDFISLGLDVVADLRNQVDNIKAKIGVVGRLYRRREDDGVLQWKLARLLDEPHEKTVEDVSRVAELDIVFEAQGGTWRAESLRTTSLSANSGTNTLALTVDGTEDVHDAVLRVTATSAISSFEVIYNGAHLQYNRSLSSGQTLIVDAGTMSVQEWDGNLTYLDRYDDLALPATHVVNGWLRLIPGTNNVQINLGSGSGTVALEHYDQWS